ncbi:MAG: putative multidrug export ATP-binding/permease protein [Verrucomicrobiae bacterium]|nr:putative multidrug export ATP-binding/permease protein [Verrucomicrobiae bacterium]
MKEIRRFLRYLKGYEGQIALAIVLILAVSALSLPYPMIVKHMLDVALPNRDWQLQKLLMLIFLANFVLKGGLQYLNRIILQRLGHRVTSDLRKDIFTHLQSLSMKYYERHQTGKIAARASHDAGAVYNLITSVLVNLVNDSVSLLTVIGMLFYIKWQLALVVIAVLPLFLLNYRLSLKTIRILSRRHRRNWDRVVGFLHERVASARLVKSFSAEAREIERFRTGIERDFRNHNQLQFFNTRLWVFAAAIGDLGVLLLFSVGGWMVIHDRLTIGELVAFSTYMGFLYSPLIRLSDMHGTVQQASTSLEKIYEVLDTPSFVTEGPATKDLPLVKGRVEFRHVQFSYDAHRRILQDINVTVEPGQLIALVGPSGAGKTTFINLLCRFYDVDSGAILLDDHDIRQVTVKSLRQQIGFVMQESILFSGTLLDNIRYGRPDADMPAIIEATKAANAHDFILALPNGYNSAVGERGVKLSGGQRQRIAIARAILKNPRLLIFDEATSALDTESERLIQDAMERLMAGRTTFVIAHRLSTILKADKIIVMKDGAIVETGRHAELIERGGLYKRLHDLQFRDE